MFNFLLKRPNYVFQDPPMYICFIGGSYYFCRKLGQRTFGWYLQYIITSHFNEVKKSVIGLYCSSDNIRKVLIFANFARRTNARIKKSRDFFYNSATKKLANSKLREKSR